MHAEELRPRLWRWTALHPDWSPAEGGADGWEQQVSSFAITGEDTIVLFDPLVPRDDEDRFWRHLDRDVERHGAPHILLTVYWHARSAGAIAHRYRGTRIWAGDAAAAAARERAPVTDTFRPGDALPAAVEALETYEPDDTAFWLPAYGALVFGDSVLGRPGGGLRVPDTWLRDGLTPAAAREALRPLLELPVELVLVTHGEPVLEDARATLERTLRA